MKKIKVAVLVVLAVGFSGAFSVWFYLGYRGVCFVRMADYRASIAEEPWVSGEVYSLGEGDYLLVLADGPSRHYEAYYVDLDHRAIGLPNFNRSKYTPVSRGAFVDKLVFEKYPYIGTLAAEWRVNEHEVGIRIMGSPPEVQEADP